MKNAKSTKKNIRKIHIIIGTKAQLIKMAPVMMELQKRKIPYNYIFTGQHQKTMNELRENFSLKDPDIILHKEKDITKVGQMLIWLIKMMFKTITKKEQIFGKTNKNDIILTHGDTFSTLLGAIMGRLARIKVGHVESGLRSFKIFHPFPEELTRLGTFCFTDYYFCPGDWAVENLKKFKGKKINTNYNTLFDALKLIQQQFHLSKIKIPTEKYATCSIHRFENIFQKKTLENIIDQILKVSKKIKIAFILHLPTKQQLQKYDLLKKLENAPNIQLHPRYDYLDFIHLVSKSEYLITDGGSNQEETFYMGKPCLLFRQATERQEGLGQNCILSKFDEEIIEEFTNNYQKYIKQAQNKIKSPSEIIVDSIIQT